MQQIEITEMVLRQAIIIFYLIKVIFFRLKLLSNKWVYM